MKHENLTLQELKARIQRRRLGEVGVVSVFIVTAMLVMPEWAYAGAGASPFTTGTTALSTNILAILTPVAVIGVMALGAAAWFNKISWGWAAGGIVGMCLVFGGQQIVTWVRGLFGV